MLNRRGAQLVGQVFPLESAIVDGRGRLKIGDAFWRAEGRDMPEGTRVRIVAVEGGSVRVEAA
jgi:membrane protein implicated in regulation of membrane protease activity